MIIDNLILNYVKELVVHPLNAVRKNVNVMIQNYATNATIAKRIVLIKISINFPIAALNLNILL